MAGNEGLIRQHKLLATGKELYDTDDFGIEPLSATSAGPHPDRGLKNELKSSERNPTVRHSRNQMPAQGNPDHGPSEY